MAAEELLWEPLKHTKKSMEDCLKRGSKANKINSVAKKRHYIDYNIEKVSTALMRKRTQEPFIGSEESLKWTLQPYEDSDLLCLNNTLKIEKKRQ